MRRRQNRRCQAHVEPVEPRLLWAAHVAGSSTSYTTIQAAVDAASAGGVVTVDAGTYAEQVTVSKRLTILGARAGVDARSGSRPTATATTESVVTGSPGTGGTSSAFHVLANDVTIDGFTVTGETSQDTALGAGIVIGPGRSGTHVVNDAVRGNVAGVFLANASATDAAVIQHDYFSANNNAGENGGRAVYTDGTISGGNLTNVTIDADTFANNRGGSGTTTFEAALAFEAGNPGEQSGIRITNSTFTGNGKATLFFNTTDVLIQGNTVTGTLDHWSGTLRFEGDNHDVRILYNTITNNTGPGVAVDSKGMPGDNGGFVVNYNNFANNNANYATRIGVANNFDTYDGTFDARYNYWGNSSGPSGYGPGTGDGVGGGYMDQTSSNSGWHLTAGGAITYAPFATATVTPPTGTAPAAPTGLTATATGTASVALAWTDNAAGNETGFTVQRSGDGGATFATVATTAAGVTTYADAAGLAPATAYAYRVYAVNTAGTSAASNTATATTKTLAVPTAPANLTATATSPTTVTLTWAAASGQTAYAVDRSTDGGVTFTTLSTTVAASATSYADAAGLAAGTAYAYRVRAINAAGSAASATAGVTTPAAGAGPVSLTTLTPTVATAGYGTVQTNASIKGNPLTLRGTVYAAGLGTHASSTITYALPAHTYTQFTADVGVDDETAGQGSVDFAVLAGSTVLYDAGVLTGTSPVAHLSVFLNGATSLTLRATPGVAGTIDFDHADWANPRLSTLTVVATSGPTSAKLTGTTVGTAGSWANAGNTAAKATDGSLGTYFDAPAANGDWVGLDLGTAKTVTSLAFAPRAGYAARMVGGTFQASTSANFTTGVTTLYTIKTAPPAGSLTTVAVTTAVAARYVRYLAPNGGYGNVAEVAFYG